MNIRIVFLATTSSELRFPDSTVTSDGEMTYIWRAGERVFGLPSKNIVAVEKLPDPAPEPPKDEPNA